MRNRLFVMLSILLFTVCGPSTDKMEKIVEDGVEVAINHLEPYRTDTPGNLILEEVLKIDTEGEAISDIGLPDIFGFVVNSSGEIYLLRTNKGEGDFIFKFRSDGTYEKSFGHQGQGPGELENPHQIAVDQQDNVLVYDGNRLVLNVYNRDGTFNHDHKLEGDVFTCEPGPRDNWLIKGFSASEEEKAVYSFDLKLLTSDFELIQTIDQYSFEFRRDKMRATEPVFSWGVGLDQIYLTNEDKGYEVDIYNDEGMLIKKIRKEYRKVPVSDSDKQRALNTFPKEMREMVKPILDFPEFHPPIHNLLVSDDGMMFAATFERGESPNEFIYDIFNQDGIFIGRTSLRIFSWEGRLWAQIRAGKLYSLEEKASGYKELVVYNMKWDR